jgi:dolichol-phosphate mannosyltransferase
MRISVVIPAFNEEGNIGRLIEETFAKVPETALGEVIAVDDASDDGTGNEIKALLGAHKRLRYLRHGQRAGQSDALRTGILAARFPIIATMDGDGQNDPADIMPLAKRLGSEGLEPAMAAGIRAARKGPSSRKAASRFAGTRQSAGRRLPRHRVWNQALPARSLPRASLFCRHASLFAGALPHLWPRNCL